MRYDLFLCGDDDLSSIAEADSGRIRINDVEYNDVCTLVEVAEKYGITVLAFLAPDIEG